MYLSDDSDRGVMLQMRNGDAFVKATNKAGQEAVLKIDQPVRRRLALFDLRDIPVGLHI